MPEGPEVETVRRSLAPLLVGAVLGRPSVGRRALRTPITSRSLAHVDGRAVVAVERHGKALFIALDSGGGLVIRLGMTGRVLVVDGGAKRDVHTHVRIPLAASARELRYVDARRFGEVVPYADSAARAAVVAAMGPDGITLNDEGRRMVYGTLAATSRALKDVLLDQTVVAGVGNIYAAEILWLARLSPFRAADSLHGAEQLRLVDAVVRVLQEAVARRGTSFSDYVDANGQKGDNQAHLAVFQREGEPCPGCGEPVRRVVQGARSTFFCATCQPKSVMQHRRRRLR